MGTTDKPYELRSRTWTGHQIWQSGKHAATFYDKELADWFLGLLKARDLIANIPKREPRKVTTLTVDCQDAEWVRTSHSKCPHYRYLNGWQYKYPGEFWEDAGVGIPGCSGYSSFTEVIE